MKKNKFRHLITKEEMMGIVGTLYSAVDEDGRQAIATCAADIPEGFGEPRPLTDSRDDALWYDETSAVLNADTVAELRAACVALANELDGFAWAFCSPDARKCFYFLSPANGEKK